MSFSQNGELLEKAFCDFKIGAGLVPAASLSNNTCILHMLIERQWYEDFVCI